MKKKHIRSGLLIQEQRYGYAMIAPVVLGFLCFIVFPLVYEIYMSGTNMTLTNPGNWVGFENYQTLAKDPKYLNAMRNTVVFTAGIVPVNILLALLLAQMLSQKIRGVGLYRTMIFIPYITPVIVWTQVWKLILSSDAGVLNAFLKVVGIQGRNWLFDMKWTMPVVIANYILKNVGYNMIIFLSAIMSVPNIYYEAAELEGAGKFSKFFRITLPLISPTTFMVVIMTIIGAFKSFSILYSLTGGGPARSTQIIIVWIYEKAFREYKFGIAAAASIILFLIILILTLIQWSMRRRMVYAEE